MHLVEVLFNVFLVICFNKLPNQFAVRLIKEYLFEFGQQLRTVNHIVYVYNHPLTQYAPNWRYSDDSDFY